MKAMMDEPENPGWFKTLYLGFSSIPNLTPNIHVILSK